VNGHALPYGFTFLPEAKCGPASSNALNQGPYPSSKDLSKFAEKMEDTQKTEDTTGKTGDTSVKQNAL